MPIAGLLAGALCASVGWMVITLGFRNARSRGQERQDSERALVDDCLANVDRVIDFPSFDHVIDIRDICDIRELGKHYPHQVASSMDDATVA